MLGVGVWDGAAALRLKAEPWSGDSGDCSLWPLVAEVRARIWPSITAASIRLMTLAAL